MAHARPSFTIGIEEEYWLVDRQTRDLVPDMPPGLVAACDKIAVGMVSPEFIRSQIEVGTPVGANIKETAEHLFALRRLVSDAVTNYGMAIISASTHPFAEWADQRHTDKERYNVLEQALQGVVRRLLICGMHVHVGIEDEDLRIDLMNQVLYFLPHLLALSTSSPYWHSADTGLKSYRTAVWRSLPRTGMPDEFDGWRDFERHAQVLIDAGVIEDATRLWWDIRPSVRYPTLEMRSTDIATRAEDAVTLAALFVSLLSMLYRLREDNQRWRIYSRMLVNENVWRAQRYGTEEGLIDYGIGEIVPFADLLDEIIELVRPDAEMLDCVEEVEQARNILERGTSADRQRAAFAKAVADGASEKEALIAVVDFLIDETVAGL
ncbi:MAG: carboxylate-amine ligase [Chloroflexi bacterium]|nr:carboxylate-amine ligase [Chloroflexota bacterium]MCH8992800.1 carboxylate-amine ligase [Acidobacteriota bacterium]